MSTFIYSNAKNRRSGTAMQKRKPRGSIEVFEYARSVLPGYPKTEKFRTNEEIAAYLRGDKIACLLCGKFYRQLSPHTARIHNIDAADYKERFGIPQCRGLVGEGKSDAARRYWASEEARPKIEKMLEAGTNRTRTSNYRPNVPATKAEMVSRIASYGIGETNAAAKLTAEQASEIKHSTERTGDLCRRFGISRTTVKGIRKGERWQSLAPQQEGPNQVHLAQAPLARGS
ncbi:MucR family transcriptional regulator [Aminobacter sp. UC22_36]|uniref:MucR family transcriptional regulator n=1 Tax=Aminobacter sp. UC22_36 TaxID=3374549 RepID=UPI00375835DC